MLWVRSTAGLNRHNPVNLSGVVLIYEGWGSTRCFSALSHLQLISLILPSGCIWMACCLQWEHKLYKIGFPVSRESSLLFLVRLKMMSEVAFFSCIWVQCALKKLERNLCDMGKKRVLFSKDNLSNSGRTNLLGKFCIHEEWSLMFVHGVVCAETSQYWLLIETHVSL